MEIGTARTSELCLLGSLFTAGRGPHPRQVFLCSVLIGRSGTHSWGASRVLPWYRTRPPVQGSEETPIHPWVGKTPWRRKRQPAPVFSPGESHGQRSLAGYSPGGHQEWDTTGHLSTQSHTVTDERLFSSMFSCVSPRKAWRDETAVCASYLGRLRLLREAE